VLTLCWFHYDIIQCTYLLVYLHIIQRRNLFQKQKIMMKRKSFSYLHAAYLIHSCHKEFMGHYLAVFPSLAGMSLTKLSLAGNNLPIPSPRKDWSKQIQESLKFLLQCSLERLLENGMGFKPSLSYQTHYVYQFRTKPLKFLKGSKSILTKNLFINNFFTGRLICHKLNSI